MGDSNLADAKMVFEELKIILNYPSAKLIVGRTTRQPNLFDCGVFVLLNSEACLTQLQASNKINQEQSVKLCGAREKYLKLGES